MNAEDKRIAIAIACGIKTPRLDRSNGWRCPSYLKDLNAMQLARKCLKSRLQKARYADKLMQLVNGDGEDTDWFSMIDATAEQHAEAFLYAKGIIE